MRKPASCLLLPQIRHERINDRFGGAVMDLQNSQATHIAPVQFSSYPTNTIQTTTPSFNGRRGALPSSSSEVSQKARPSDGYLSESHHSLFGTAIDLLHDAGTDKHEKGIFLRSYLPTEPTTGPVGRAAGVRFPTEVFGLFISTSDRLYNGAYPAFQTETLRKR
jgi:hypothetical protein